MQSGILANTVNLLQKEDLVRAGDESIDDVVEVDIRPESVDANEFTVHVENKPKPAITNPAKSNKDIAHAVKPFENSLVNMGSVVKKPGQAKPNLAPEERKAADHKAKVTK